MEEQNPLFIYDGRRMRTLTDRKYTDYASPCLYSLDCNFQPPLASKITKNLQHISVNKIRSPVHCLAFTKDGRRLISGSLTGEFTLWNTIGFNFETILVAHETCVRAIKTTNSLVVSGDANGNFKLWDLSLTNIYKKDLFSESIRDISTNWLEDRAVVSGDSSAIKIIDFSSGNESILKSHLWDVRQAKWHKDKALIVSGGKDTTIKLWDPREKKCLKTLHIHKNAIFSLIWSRDGNSIYSGGKDQSLKVLDLRTLKSFGYKTQGSDITKIVEHPHANMLVACTANGALYFYESIYDHFYNDNFNPLLENHSLSSNTSNEAALNEKQHPTNEKDDFCKSNKDNYEWIGSLNKAHDHVIWAAEYHPIGHVLATGSLDQSIRWWTRFGENRPIDRNNPVIPDCQKSENEDIKEEIPGFQ